MEGAECQLSDQVLVEITSMADLMVPLQRSSRIKYNCVSVSSKLIAIGSNTGGIYLFSKRDCKQIQIAFAEKETNPVSKVLISPNEKFIAIVASSGVVHVVDMKLDTRAKPDTVRSTPMIGGALATVILWDPTSTRLYVGDNLGKVSMVPVHSNKAKNLFSLPIEVIMKLDSYIVQLDKAEDKLLVSTLTKCYLCDTVRQTYSQIGKRPRDGHYGACFLTSDSAAPMVYSARPGSRIWEVDYEGNVLNTHQFRQLIAIPPQTVLKVDGQFSPPDLREKYPEQSISFPKLIILGDNLLLSWTDSAVYILDPINVKVILWCKQFSGIVDVMCVKREIFVFLQTMQVVCVTIMPSSQLISLCMNVRNLEMAANLSVFYSYTFHQRRVRKQFGVRDLRRIYDELVAMEMMDMSEKIHAVITALELRTSLESGSESSDSSRSRANSTLDNVNTTKDNVKTSIVEDLTGLTQPLTVKQAGDTELLSGKVDADVQVRLNQNQGQPCNGCVEEACLSKMDQMKPTAEIGGTSIETKQGNCGVVVGGDVADLAGSPQAAIKTNFANDNEKTIPTFNVLGNEDEMDGKGTSNPYGNTFGDNCDVQTAMEIKHSDDGVEELDADIDYTNDTKEIQLVQKYSSHETDTSHTDDDGKFIGHSDKVSDIQNTPCGDGQKTAPDTSCVDRLVDAQNKTCVQTDADSIPICVDNVKSNQNVKVQDKSFSNGAKAENIVCDVEVADDGSMIAGMHTSTLRVQSPYGKSVSPLPPYGRMHDGLMTGIGEEEEDGFSGNYKGLGSRRNSLTSLSSLSSAEVYLDQLPARDFSAGYDPNEQIAIPVRKKKHSRKSRRMKSVEENKSSPVKEGRQSRSQSLGALFEKRPNTENRVSSSLTMQRAISEDCASELSIESSLPNITVDCVSELFIDSSLPNIMVETQSDSQQEVDVCTSPPPAKKIVDGLSPPFATSPDLTYSGEFGRSDEFSPVGSPLTQSWDVDKHETSTLTQSWDSGKQETSGPSSAPKTALLQFRDKVQTKVASKTKKIIKNIKDKNLLTRAKVFAENLSQAHDNTMAYPGEIFVTDSLAASNKESTPERIPYKLSHDDGGDEVYHVESSLIDIKHLQEKTAETKQKLEDIEVIMDPGAIQPILLEWITILNQTFHQIHVKKFTKSGNDVENKDTAKEENVATENASTETDSKDSGQTESAVTEDMSDETDAHTNVSIIPGEQEHSAIPTEIESKACVQCTENIDNIAVDLGARILNDRNFCYSKDPLCLSKPLLRDVSELTQACFDIGCHGNILQYQRLDISSDKIGAVLKRIIHNKDKQESAISDMQDGNNCDNKDSVSAETCSSGNSQPCCMVNDTGSTLDRVADVDAPDDADHSELDNKGRHCMDENRHKVEPESSEIPDDKGTSRELPDGENKQGTEFDSNDDGELRHSSAGDISVYSDGSIKGQNDGQHSSTEAFPIKDLPPVIGQGESPDLALAFFVRCYFPYLCAGRVKERIQERDDRYLTWCALVSCLQISAEEDRERYGVENKSMINHLLDSHAHSLPGANGTALLGHISKLFASSSSSIVPVCIKCYPHIRPLDVLYMCRLHNVAMETMFATYMSSMMEQASRTYRDLLSDLCQHCMVKMVWLETLLTEGPEMSALINEGTEPSAMLNNEPVLGTVLNEDKLPRVMSHTLGWRNSTLIDKVLQVSSDQSHIPAMMTLCRKYGYWKGVLMLLKAQGQRSSQLQMILQLGDIDLLSGNHTLGYLPDTVTEWERLLDQYKLLVSKKGNQSTVPARSDWPATITWNNLAILLVKSTGPERALSLLEKCGVPDGMLSPSFYKTCMLSGLVQKHQKLVLQSMLEKVDTYLWSQRPNVFSPQLHYLLVNEKSLSGETTRMEDDKGEVTEQQEKVQFLANRLRDDRGSHLFAEDPECHWGVETKFNLLCPCCSVSLREPISHVDPGVLLFRCGHGYHKLCIPHRECVLCDSADVHKGSDDGQFVL